MAEKWWTRQRKATAWLAAAALAIGLGAVIGSEIAAQREHCERVNYYAGYDAC